MRCGYSSRILCLIALAWPAAAQTPDHYIIGGAVVNSVTGEPVRNALVTLLGVPSMDDIGAGRANFDPADAPPRKTTFTGPAGEFEFIGVGKGSYQLSAQKPGFNPAFGDPENRPPRIEELASSVSGVQIKLAPMGAIEGKVVDQYGDPIPHGNIAVITVMVLDGYQSTSVSRTATTDDRGIFRVANLPAGKYYVKATGKTGGTYMYVGENATRADTWESFAPAYFGGGAELISVTPFVIGAGTEARADLSLKLEPAFKIRGALENFTAHETVAFTLIQGEEEVSASRSTLNGTNGKFEIDDVIAGNYLLRAQQGSKTRGELPVSVSGGDVNDVPVTLSPPVAVQVSERMIGELPKMPPDPDGDREDSGPAGCTVNLHSSRGRENVIGLRGFVAQRQTNGEMNIPAVFAGRYRIQVVCSGGYPLSIQSGGTDLFANPQITIQPGVAPAPIEINLKLGGGTIEGKLELDPFPPQAGVLLVPKFSASTGPRMTPVGAFPGAGDQHFEFENLAPGDYMVYALSNTHGLEFRDPTFLQALTNGVGVKVEDGKTSKIELSSVAK
jgi:hypothetical protein